MVEGARVVVIGSGGFVGDASRIQSAGGLVLVIGHKLNDRAPFTGISVNRLNVDHGIA